MPVVLAIDGNSLVHRSFHSHSRGASATPGPGVQLSWAVRGLLTQLVAAVDRIRPDVVVVGFDDPDRSLRRERWPEYKAQRGEKLDTLVAQLDEAVTVVRALGLAVVVPPGLEADDVVASAAAHARRAGGETVVVTSDRDAFALIDDRTRVLRIINGGVDASPLMTPDRLMMLLGVYPWQYRDFAALRGDPSDNLPGVRGIGPRNGARLLAEFGSAQAAFDDLEGVRHKFGVGLANRLAHPDARVAWQRNCAIMAARDDIELDLGSSGGCGALPLAADAVRSVFRAQNLVWSVSDALRVLAEVDEPRPERPDPGWPVTAWTSPRPARLPAAKPKADQLALF